MAPDGGLIYSGERRAMGGRRQRYDVLVVGAGLCGLSLAWHLRRAGVDVAVVEARARVGGRLLTAELDGVAYDLGGQTVHPSQLRVQALVRELGLQTRRAHRRGRCVLSVGGRLTTCRGGVPATSLVARTQLELQVRRLRRLAAFVPLDAPETAARAFEWDGMSVATFHQELTASRNARALLDGGLRLALGAEPDEVSLLHHLFRLNSCGDARKLLAVDEGEAAEQRIAGGAQGLAVGLAARLGERRLTLGAPVAAVEQDDEEVRLVLDGSKVAARYAVVTVPPPLASGPCYEPALPEPRATGQGRWLMGAVATALVAYDEPTWESRGLSGGAVCAEGIIHRVRNVTAPDGGQACLQAVLVGRQARAWGQLAAVARRKVVTAELDHLLGAPASAVTHYVEYDWTLDPWAAGGPTASLGPGATTSYAAASRTAFGRLHWAGAEVARHGHGTMEGALESAERVAAEVLGRLG